MGAEIGELHQPAKDVREEIRGLDEDGVFAVYEVGDVDYLVERIVSAAAPVIMIGPRGRLPHEIHKVPLVTALVEDDNRVALVISLALMATLHCEEKVSDGSTPGVSKVRALGPPRHLRMPMTGRQNRRRDASSSAAT